jgi:hypothetical protein
VETFNASSFVAALAAGLGVPESRVVILSVAPASIRVVVAVTVVDSEADPVAVTATLSDEAPLEAALAAGAASTGGGSFDVEGAPVVTTAPVLLPAPSPPPMAPPSQPACNGSAFELELATAGGGAGWNGSQLSIGAQDFTAAPGRARNISACVPASDACAQVRFAPSGWPAQEFPVSGQRWALRAGGEPLLSGGADEPHAMRHWGSVGGGCDEPCACDPGGVGGLAPGCAQHLAHGDDAAGASFCYVALPLRCAEATPSQLYEGHAWRWCGLLGASPSPPPPPPPPPACEWSARGACVLTVWGWTQTIHRWRLFVAWLGVSALLLALTLRLLFVELRARPPTLRRRDSVPILFALLQLVSAVLFLSTTPSDPPRHLVGIWGDPDPAMPFFFAALGTLLLSAAVCAALLLGLARRDDLLDARAALTSTTSFATLCLLSLFGSAELPRLLPATLADTQQLLENLELLRCCAMWLVQARPPLRT